MQCLAQLIALTKGSIAHRIVNAFLLLSGKMSYSSYLIRGLIAPLLFVALQLQGQLNLLHNGGFQQLCPQQGQTYIDGELVNEKGDANFFVSSTLFRSGNTSPTYWRCNSTIDNGSYFWFQKNDVGTEFFAKILGYTQLNGKHLQHKAKEITGLLKRPLKKDETVSINIWSRLRSPYDISKLNLNCYVSTDITTPNSDTFGIITWDEITIVKKIDNILFINYQATHYPQGNELYVTLTLPELIESDFGSKDYKLIRKKTKGNKKKGTNSYDYLEVKIDSISIVSVHDNYLDHGSIEALPNKDESSIVIIPKKENNILPPPLTKFRDSLFITSLYFDTDVSEVANATLSNLKARINTWTHNTQDSITFIVNGFTDCNGSEESNFELSLKRAQTVGAYLRKLQESSEVITTGLGKCLECNGAKCRRVDIYLIR